MIFYILSGLLGVTNMILWGLYGDLLVEKFNILKVFRSVLLGVLWSIFLFIINPNLPLFVIALITISLERISTEIYKALIRVEDQSKYKIPTHWDIGINRNLKLQYAILIFLIIGMALYSKDIYINKIYLILITGFFCALGGMTKDAPHEGFSLLKFFRSPVVSIIVGVGIYFLFPDIYGKFFVLAIAGGERIISEFYKKIVRGRVPGKFKQKEFNEIWMRQRKNLLFLYAFNIIGLVNLILV
ncbi:MAG: hypothetical protein FK730_13915 [Asgard group archaeon]|nr:hypothetical protein [Asgard group archaeon]